MKKLILFLFVFLFLPFCSKADTSHVVINQVQVAGATASDEFIELYNPLVSPVSLAGWSIQYKNSNGNFSKKLLPDASIPPSGYFLFAGSGYSGTVTPDMSQSSISLAATVGTIYLVSDTATLVTGSEATIVDSLAYGTDLDVPQAGSALVRTDSGFVEQISDPHNLASTVSAPDQQPGQQQTPPPPPPPQQTSGGGSSAPVYSHSILISEMLPNPEGSDSGKEWIELFNSSDSTVDLGNWILDDESSDGSTGTSAYTIPEGTQIQAKSYLAIDIPAGNFALDNTGGDSLRLIWPDKNMASMVSYITTAPQDSSFTKNSDGIYVWTTILTKGSANLFSLTEVSTDDNDNEENGDEDVKDVVVKSKAEDFTNAKILLSEVFPNPVGDDAGAEWIELENQGTDAVNLHNWVLDDGEVDAAIGSTAYIIQNYTIQPGELVALQIPKNKFAMNNTGTETVRLLSPDKKLVDSVTYSGVKEDLSYAKVDGTWVVATPTPSEANAAPAIVTKIGKVAGKTLVRTGNPEGQSDYTLYYFALFTIIWYIVGRILKTGETENE